MPLVNARELLLDAQAHSYAVGAFNVENMEMMQAVICAAEQQEEAPVVLQTTPTTVKYGGTALFASMARAMAQESAARIAIHLDHGSSLELCTRAAGDGYTSLMIDGSALPIGDNIALVRKVTEMAAALSGKPCVEAELGKLGGKEEPAEAEPEGDVYTDPDEAARFVRETGVDSLAVAIGTAHGVYKGKPQIDFSRLAQLHEAVPVPLVLHGSSGVPDGDVQRAISLGICKVNFATELRFAYTNAARSCLNSDSGVYDPKRFGAQGREAVAELVRHRIRVCMGRD